MFDNFLNSWQFNPYAILPLITSLVIIYFGVFLYYKNYKSFLNKIIFFWCLSIFGWLFGYALVYSTTNTEIAAILAKLVACSIMFIYVVAYHFIACFLENKKETKFVKAAYFLAIILAPFFLFTDYFVAGVRPLFFGFYGKAGPLYIYSVILFSSIFLRPIWLIIIELRNDRHSSSQSSVQKKYILLAFFIASLAAIDFLPKFNIAIYPLGSLFMLIWVAIISYAILKHKLMDITIVIKKGLVYSILISLITIVYLMLIISFEKFFQPFLGYNSPLGSLFAAIIIAVMFSPLRGKVQHYIDKLFFKGTPSELAYQNELLRREVAESEKSKAVATLASGIAHEIKNPLTALKAFFEYFPEKRNDSSFVEKFSNVGDREISRIDNLVLQLLEFAKPSPLQLRETNICALLNNSLNLLENQFKKHNIQIITEYPQNVNSSIKADPSRLEQAFINLFLNAIDAMPNGGNLYISVNLRNFQHCQIMIKDTGIGISKNDLSHIFDPFFTKKSNGTGLGLAITQGIIQDHGGRIKAKSRMGEGTNFIINLPFKS